MADWTRAGAASHARKYGAAHRRLRAQWRPHVLGGMVDCALCGVRIPALAFWDLSHDPLGGPDDYLGPAHAGCNRATESTGEKRRHGRTSSTGAGGAGPNTGQPSTGRGRGILVGGSAPYLFLPDCPWNEDRPIPWNAILRSEQEAWRRGELDPAALDPWRHRDAA